MHCSYKTNRQKEGNNVVIKQVSGKGFQILVNEHSDPNMKQGSLHGNHRLQAQSSVLHVILFITLLQFSNMVTDLGSSNF